MRLESRDWRSDYLISTNLVSLIKNNQLIKDSPLRPPKRVEGQDKLLFEKLTVYQKSIQFAEEVSNAIESFAKGNGYIID